MTEREERIADRAEELRLPWTRPELHRLEAGGAEASTLANSDGVTVS